MKSHVIHVICIRETDKGVLLKSKKTGDELWFPKSKVQIVLGEFAQGMELTVNIHSEVIKQARQNKANQETQTIRFSDPVLVSGYCTEDNPRSIGVLCDADRVQRWLPKTKVIKVETVVVPDQPIRVVIPAWLLKRANNSFPEWVKGAIYD